MLGTYDFSAPIFRAVLITDPKSPVGPRYAFWMDPANDAANPLAHGLQLSLPNGLKSLAYATDLTVELQLAHVPKTTLVLSPPLDEARRFLDSDLIEWARTELEVVFGYEGRSGTALTEAFRGIVLEPQVSLGPDVSITLNVQGVGGFRAARTPVSGTLATQTRLEVIRLLAANMGLTVELPKGDPDTLRALQLTPVTSVKAGDYALDVIYELVRLTNCWMNLVDDRIVIVSTRAAILAEPRFNFRFFDFPDGRIGPQNGVFPILSVSSPPAYIFLPQNVRGFVTKGTSSETRETKQIVVDPATAPTATTADSQTVPKEGAKPEENFQFMDAVSPDAEAKAKQVHQEFSASMGLKLEIETLGIPTLNPGAIVGIAGLGRRIDDKYIVFEVTHQIGTGGYTTKFTCYKNSAQLLKGVAEAFKPLVPNRQEVKEQKADAADPLGTIPVAAKPG